MKYFSVDNRPKPQTEDHSKEPSRTETAGYIPADVQIQQFLIAGRKLGDFRREQFDGDGEFDITRRPNYDMADAFQDKLNLGSKMNQQAAEAIAEEKARKIDEKKAEEEKGKKEKEGEK